jgi:hypothetical protein
MQPARLVERFQTIMRHANHLDTLRNQQVAQPFEEEGVVLSDFATSVAAEGKIRVYRARGHKLPNGWIIDQRGGPSNDPNDFYAGGAILPVGGSVGHKGFCLSFMTDLFGGILSGDGFPAIPGKQFSRPLQAKPAKVTFARKSSKSQQIQSCQRSRYSAVHAARERVQASQDQGCETLQIFISCPQTLKLPCNLIG